MTFNLQKVRLLNATYQKREIVVEREKLGLKHIAPIQIYYTTLQKPILAT